MNETVREWIEKAEGDYRTAGRELNVDDSPNYDAVCFHAQQCIEKLMKAVLLQRNVIPQKTHDLVALQRELVSHVAKWDADVDALRFLTLAAVHYRYPGESAGKSDAEAAVESCGRVRDELLKLLAEAGE